MARNQQHKSGAFRSEAAILLLAILLAAWAPACHGHGFLLSPLSRARVLGYPEYDSSAGNGLGTSPFRKNPDGSLLNDQADVCGDPHQDAGDLQLRSKVTAVQATYSAGQTITVTYRVRVNHGGWIGLKICPSTRTNPTQSCFDAHPLINADTNYQRWWFQTGKYDTSVTTAQYTTRWRLPAGVSCDGGCVMQVTYRTANSCVDQCAPAECGPIYAARYNPVTNQPGPLSPCGRTEIFKDCADVRITPGGGSNNGGTPQRSPPPPPPSSSSNTGCGLSATAFCAGKAPGFYGDKCTGCTKYFWCYSGGAAYMSCGAGTAMDSRGRQGGCNYPQNIVC